MLLLMDEATSALDSQTERELLKSLDTLLTSKTVITVTHKIANSMNADIIICMKNGQICEIGTPSELIRADNYFAGLYKLQNILEVLSNETDKTAAS